MTTQRAAWTSPTLMTLASGSESTFDLSKHVKIGECISFGEHDLCSPIIVAPQQNEVEGES